MVGGLGAGLEREEGGFLGFFSSTSAYRSCTEYENTIKAHQTEKKHMCNYANEIYSRVSSYINSWIIPFDVGSYIEVPKQRDNLAKKSDLSAPLDHCGYYNS